MKEKILLLHGALGTKDQFSDLKKMLEEQFDVFDINFAGHGGIPSQEPFSIKLFTQNVIEFIQKSQIESVTIFGYSMGGYIGLNAALALPEIVNKVVTLGTKFDWTKETAEKEVKMLNPSKIEEKVPAFARKLDSDHKPLDWKNVVSSTAEMMTKMGMGERIHNQEFKTLKQPIILGLGSLDNMVTLEETEAISNLIPDCTMITLEGAHHPIGKVALSQLFSYIQSSLG